MTFYQRLKSIRVERGYTQRDVYTLLNISPNGYASYEQGRTEPNIEMIIKLCKIFNISSDYLLGLEDEYGNKINTPNINTYNNNGTHIGDVNF